MAQAQHTPTLASLEEAVTVLFCLIDDAYALLNPNRRTYESLKRLSDSEVLTLALFQQLEGRGERALVFARRPALLLPPLPRGGGDAPLLAAPSREEAEAFPGALAPLCPARIGRRSRDPRRRLDAA